MRLNGRAIPILLLAATALGPRPAAAENELQAFGALVEGTWVGDGTRHVFEWGVGRRALRSRTYSGTGDRWTLVGEGMWFWDADAGAIRGVAVAVGMPVDLFEYRSAVRGVEIVHSLAAQGPMGGQFVERWQFAEGEYSWALETAGDGPRERLMGGTYRRAPDPPRQ